jgi:DNA-binding beta-propeller fold protein YncE
MKTYLTLCIAVLSFGATAQTDSLALRAELNFLQLPEGDNFGEVTGIALRPNGNLLVFHRGPRPLLEFDKQGKFVREIGAGMFSSAHGLRVDRQGNIWTTDVGSHLVLKFNPEGRTVLVLGRRGTPGTWDEDKQMILFDKPADVGFDADDNIYVADGYGNSRIVKLDPYGNLMKAWGEKGSAEGEFDNPHNVLIDPQGRVLVADRYNKRIQIFDQDGKFLDAWTHLGVPSGLALYDDRVLYITDGTAEQVVKANLMGQELGRFGGPGRAPGQFYIAHGICVDEDENVYVSEVFNWRVQRLSPNGIP